MTSDDEDQHSEPAGDSRGASDAHAGDGWSGPVSDPIRDLILGFAAQIDQVAALFAGGTRPAAAAAATGGTAGSTAPGPSIPELAGEVTGLLAEIGDLLARLIAALIAVLEAIAAALRSTPSPHARPGPAHYQAIAVRIDPAATAPGPRHAAHDPEPEGGV